MKAEVLAILSDVSESQYRIKMVNISEHIATEVNKELSTCGYTELNAEQLVSLYMIQKVKVHIFWFYHIWGVNLAIGETCFKCKFQLHFNFSYLNFLDSRVWKC